MIISQPHRPRLNVASFIESNELKKLMGWLKGASTKEIPAGSVTTFQLGQILPGDAVFLPFGSIFVEKALNAHSVTLKVPMNIFDSDCKDDFLVLVDQVPAKPAIEAFPGRRGMRVGSDDFFVTSWW